MKVSIVVPAYNEEKLIGASLEAMKTAMEAFHELGWETELVVCDNNSSDRTAELARAAGAKVVFEPVNQIGRARNCGAAGATGDWLIFVDADSHPSRELFREVASQVRSGTCIGGGCTVRMDAPHRVAHVLCGLWNRISRWKGWAAGSFVYNLRWLAPLLELEGWQRLRQGNFEATFDTIETLLGNARALAQEPYLVAQSRRLEVLQAALGLLERLLSRQSLTVSQLHGLEKELGDAATDTGRAISRALMAERCLMIYSMQFPRRAFGPPTPQPAAQQLAEALAQSFASLFASTDRSILEFLPTTDQVIADAADVSSTRYWRLVGYQTRATEMLPQQFLGLASNWRHTISEQAELAAGLRVARAALWLERDRLEHGLRPSLSAEILKQRVSWQDPFSPGLFQYKVLTNGFLVYSVGIDGYDDGGRTREVTNRAIVDGRYDLTFRISR